MEQREGPFQSCAAQKILHIKQGLEPSWFSKGQGQLRHIVPVPELFNKASCLPAVRGETKKLEPQDSLGLLAQACHYRSL